VATLKEGERLTLPVKVVVSGSYKRAVDALRTDFDYFGGAGCTVLSPRSLDFTRTEEGFVFTAEDDRRPARDVELGHLRAIGSADFVWLHAPGGYIGQSGAMELGYALAMSVPVFCRERPTDVTLREFVTVVDHPRRALECQTGAPSTYEATTSVFASLSRMQRYYQWASAKRGFAKETLTDAMVLVTEEIGELARAVRQTVQITRHGRPTNASLPSELADVFLYLLHMASIANVDFARAVADKEIVNGERARDRG
jgi:NTP pyrophosphatase (non-canonical NTP hydrolase)